jgi:hypothetical protein
VNSLRSLPLALAACALFPAAASAQAGPDPAAAPALAELSRATVVGAAGGFTAWSAYEGGAYRLVVRAPDGTQGPAPVATRKVPFDLDLGTDASGRVVAAYSRCTKEPTLVGGANATAPNYTSGGGCRVVLYDLASQRERTLPRSKGSSSDVLPAVGGSRIAFISVPTARRLKGKAQLRWRTTTSATAKVLDTGVRRTGTASVSGGPAGVDTDGRRVAVVWRYEDHEFHDFNSVLRVGTFTGRPRQVAFGVNGEACNYHQVLAPTLTGTTVTYLESSADAWALGRTPVASSAATYGAGLTGTETVVTSGAVDGARLVVAETASPRGVGHAAGPTRIRQLPVGTFAKASPVEFCAGA